MPVTFPTTQGFTWPTYPSTTTTGTGASTDLTFDVADMVAMGGRGLVAGTAVSAGIRKVFQKSAEQAILKEGSAAMMRAAAHQAEGAALSLGTGVPTAAKGLVVKGVASTTEQVAAHGMKATSLRAAAAEVEGSIAAPKAGGLFKGSLGLTIKRSALIGGLISGVTNVYKAITGQITATRAGGNVVADTAGAVVGGVAAAAASGLVAAAIGVPGALMTGATFLVGAAAFIGVDFLLKKTGVHGIISDGATGLIENIVDKFKTHIGPGGV
jgi:hypothetical protein